jgi:hypothetical protein
VCSAILDRLLHPDMCSVRPAQLANQNQQPGGGTMTNAIGENDAGQEAAQSPRNL